LTTYLGEAGKPENQVIRSGSTYVAMLPRDAHDTASGCVSSANRRYFAETIARDRSKRDAASAKRAPNFTRINL